MATALPYLIGAGGAIVAAIIGASGTVWASTRSRLIQRWLAGSQVRQADAATDKTRLDTADQAMRMYGEAMAAVRGLSKEVTELKQELERVKEFVRNVHRSAPQIGVHVTERGVLSVLPGAPILVVDDDLDIARALRLWLEEDNYQVTAVGTVAEALAVVNSQHVALAILDLYIGADTAMPIVEAIRAAVTVRNTQIVVMTAATDQEAQALVRAIDPVTTIRKPFDFTDLRPVVMTALAKRASSGTP